MGALDESMLGGGGLIRPLPRLVRESWRVAVDQRLRWAYQAAARIPFDDADRFVFFSDLHRGDNRRTDAFAPNKPLFLRAMRHYYDTGYTYVEVGDGDELWQNRRFADIRRAHAAVFDWLHRFHDAGRLYLILGNHDSGRRLTDTRLKDGLRTCHALLLQHRGSGRALFVVHGHQADMLSDRTWGMARFAARTLWRCLFAVGFQKWHYISAPGEGHHLVHVPGWLSRRILAQPRRIALRIEEWVAPRRLPVICGHTHLTAFPQPGAAPYFNTGSCINPGFLTGIELADGQISLVKWTWVGETAVRSVLQTAPLAAFA
ncbi:MAG: hypothetical protein KC425_16795 [Anaerolineales bacterium]|nr:hypothetical protein [Anaerolineales bacterium]